LIENTSFNLSCFYQQKKRKHKNSVARFLLNTVYKLIQIAQFKTIGDIIMKRSTFITLISLLIPLFGMSQTNTKFVDDLYYKPGDEKTIVNTQKTQKTPNYKNGAKEIIYIDRENPNSKVVHDTVYVVGDANQRLGNISGKDGHDTVYVVGQANDSTEYTQENQEQGHYLNGFNGTESDMDYAERIRRFHNPKYEIFIGDPRYNEINFLNNNDWNVYVDGSYAYVTPTWTNPYWWNYNYSPYSYGNWGFGFNNFYSPFCSPWGFDSFYGGYGYGGFGYGGFGYGGMYGYGYGGMYGYGYGGYGFGGYGGYGGYGYDNWGGYSGRSSNYNEQNRRDVSNNNGSSRLGGTRNSASTTIAGGNYSNGSRYTTISGSRNNSATTNVSGTRSATPSNLRSTSNSNGIGNVRSTGTRYGLSSSNGTNTLTRSSNVNINTRPRTYTTTTLNVPAGSSTPRVNNSVVNSGRSTYSSGASRSYNSSSTQNSSVNSRSSSPTYSSGSTSTYSSGNSGGGRSSGSSSSGGSSSGGGGGGGRSSGGGGGRR